MSFMQIFSRSVTKREGKLGDLAFNAVTRYLQLDEFDKTNHEKARQKAISKGPKGIPVDVPKVGMTAMYLPSFTLSHPLLPFSNV